MKTIPLDMFLTFGLGLLFSIAAHKAGPVPGSVFRTRHFRISLFYMVCVGLGLAVLCYMIEPDWMWMYFLDRGAIPKPARLAFTIYAFSFYFWMFCLGYLVAPELEKYQPGLARRLYYVLNAVVVLVCVVFIHRLWFVGSFGEYAAGHAQGMIQLHPFRIQAVGWILLLAAPPVFISLYWMYGKISREATRQAGQS